MFLLKQEPEGCYIYTSHSSICIRNVIMEEGSVVALIFGIRDGFMDSE